jgi:hypothetical protein
MCPAKQTKEEEKQSPISQINLHFGTITPAFMDGFDA